MLHFDSIPLHGDGFSEFVARQKAAVELEDRVNREIRLLMASEQCLLMRKVLLII
jgi:hypothetical protein